MNVRLAKIAVATNVAFWGWLLMRLLRVSFAESILFLDDRGMAINVFMVGLLASVGSVVVYARTRSKSQKARRLPSTFDEFLRETSPSPTPVRRAMVRRAYGEGLPDQGARPEGRAEAKLAAANPQPPRGDPGGRPIAKPWDDDTPMAAADGGGRISSLSRQRRSRAQRPPPPEDVDEGNGTDLSDDKIRRIIAANRRFRTKLKVFGKGVGAMLCLLLLYWVASDFTAMLKMGASIVLFIFVLIRIHMAFPILFVVIYGLFALLIGVIYAIPYRIIRKVVRVTVDGKAKDLGRAVLVKGCDRHGNPPPGLLYSVWYAWRRVTRSGQPRPSPHEFPLGDAYYLWGRKVRVKVQANGDEERVMEVRERFNYCIMFQNNTEGWFRRRRHPTALYLNGDIDIGWMMIRIVDAGFKLHSIHREGIDSSAHFELSGTPSVMVLRELEPYRKLRNATIDDAAGLVTRGVKADSELAKDAQREFNLPSPSTLAEKYGIILDEEGNPTDKPVKKPERKEEEP